MTQNEKRIGNAFSNVEIKPLVLENQIAERDDFMSLSCNMKRALMGTNDKKDRKMVLPISGYSGHRRGERSANFFGKSFRETTLQSKKLQRELFSSTSPRRDF